MLLLVVFLLALAPAAHASGWTRPVGGEVVEPFAYDAAAPFAGGQHRGVDFAARAGEPVRAPCSGTVTFAGRVPDRGRGVTLHCGALAATVVELQRVAVRKGDRVRRGEPIARAGDVVQLGARRWGERLAYVDPLALIAEVPPPLGPAPPPARPKQPRPAPSERPRPAPVGRLLAAPAERPGVAAERPVMAPAERHRLAPGARRGVAPGTRRGVAPVPAGAAGGVPLLAWVGLALVAGGVPLGVVARRRRRVTRGAVGAVVR